MLAQIARTTTEKERSAAFALFMAARQFGLIFGPALNLVLEQLDFYIGPYVCNKLTAPGVSGRADCFLYVAMCRNV